MKPGGSLSGSGERGEVRRRLQATDWGASPLGPLAEWPSCLRTMLDVVLASDRAMCLLWGPELRVLYNDAFVPLLGAAHPSALGSPAGELVGPLWALRDHIRRHVLEAGESLRLDDPLITARATLSGGGPMVGFVDPVRRADDTVGGALVTLDETTRSTGSSLEILANIGAVLDLSEPDHSLSRAVHLVARALGDFSVLFLLGADGALLRHAAAGRDPAWNELVERTLSSPIGSPLARLVETCRAERRVVEVEVDEHADFASGWVLEELRRARPTHAVAVPLLAGECVGVLGLSSRTRRYDTREIQLLQEIAQRLATFVRDKRLAMATADALRSRDEVLAAVAHDLRSPLNAIVLEATLLSRQKRLEHGDPSPLIHIQSAASRMNRLIADLLDVARVEAGQRLAVELAPVCAKALLADAVAEQGVSAHAAKRELRLETPSDLPEVMADRARVIRVLENLIGNAIKFSPPGTTIMVGAKRERDGVVIHVENESALAPEVLAHAFDPFWQSRVDQRGAGLGLSIAKQLVEAQGGRIWAESTPGGKAAFFFTLPEARHPSGPQLARGEPRGPVSRASSTAETTGVGESELVSVDKKLA